MNDLEAFLVQHLPVDVKDKGRVSSAALEQLWSELFPHDNYSSRRGREAFLKAVQTTATGSGGQEQLEFRPGGWEVNLGKGLAQTVVATALLGGILVMLGTAGLPAAVLTAVIPLLFDVSRTRLTDSQDYVLAELVVNPDVLKGELTTDQLYESLSAETRRSITRLEFRDFLDAFRRAGLADHQSDDRVILRPTDQARFRITFR
ncbi:hypothetical protein ACIBI7_53370 [Nonomuraea fuscirosea]|uniref:hypothetical protein n=1 Tax=Nonomuraea fuscirosea TaxID=1291556 RepID=UPI0037BD4C79